MLEPLDLELPKMQRGLNLWFQRRGLPMNISKMAYTKDLRFDVRAKTLFRKYEYQMKVLQHSDLLKAQNLAS